MENIEKFVCKSITRQICIIGNLQDYYLQSHFRVFRHQCSRQKLFPL